MSFPKRRVIALAALFCAPAAFFAPSESVRTATKIVEVQQPPAIQAARGIPQNAPTYIISYASYTDERISGIGGKVELLFESLVDERQSAFDRKTVTRDFADLQPTATDRAS